MSYSESLSGTLSTIGATEGTRLRVSKEGRTFEGTLMPHHEFSAPDVDLKRLPKELSHAFFSLWCIRTSLR